MGSVVCQVPRFLPFVSCLVCLSSYIRAHRDDEEEEEVMTLLSSSIHHFVYLLLVMIVLLLTMFKEEKCLWKKTIRPIVML